MKRSRWDRGACCMRARCSARTASVSNWRAALIKKSRRWVWCGWAATWRSGRTRASTARRWGHRDRRWDEARQHGAHRAQLPDREACGDRGADRTGGGVTIGDYAVVGGQVGVGDKARIEAKAIIGSGAGILTAKIVRAGEPVWGTPARPLRQYLAQLATLARLTKRG